MIVRGSWDFKLVSHALRLPGEEGAKSQIAAGAGERSDEGRGGGVGRFHGRRLIPRGRREGLVGWGGRSDWQVERIAERLSRVYPMPRKPVMEKQGRRQTGRMRM